VFLSLAFGENLLHAGGEVLLGLRQLALGNTVEISEKGWRWIFNPVWIEFQNRTLRRNFGRSFFGYHFGSSETRKRLLIQDNIAENVRTILHLQAVVNTPLPQKSFRHKKAQEAQMIFLSFCAFCATLKFL
jgi:hypothetical protein